MTTSLQLRDNHGGSEGEGDSNGDKKCCASAIMGLGDNRPCPQAATAAALVLACEAVALVLAAEAAASLMAADANGGDGSTAIVGVASLAMGVE